MIYQTSKIGYLIYSDRYATATHHGKENGARDGYTWYSNRNSLSGFECRVLGYFDYQGI